MTLTSRNLANVLMFGKARGRLASRRTSSTVDVLALRHTSNGDNLASDRMTNRRG